MFSRLKQIARWYEAWRDAVPVPRMRSPVVIQFPVNDICNSRCQMCRIWEQKRDFEISPEQTRKVLSSPLFRSVRGVGINGGEPTLRKDIRELTTAIVESLPKLEAIYLITNAVIVEQVTGAMTAMGEVCRSHGVRFDAMVSLDGIGAVHDLVRGKPGNFAAAMKVIDFARKSPVVDMTRIGFTAVKDNVFDVENVLYWAMRENVNARFRIGIPHPRLYSLDIEDPFRWGPDETFHFANFLDYLHDHYETEPARRAFYRSLRNQLVYQQPRAAGCLWKYTGATLSSRGELSYCAVASPNLGSAISDDPERLYWSNQSVLKEIVENHCATCLHDYSGIADRTIVRAQISEAIKSKVKRIVPVSVWNGMKHFSDRSERKRMRRALELKREAVELRRNIDVRQAANASGTGGRILLCGWYGTETLGDKGILAGIVSLVRQTTSAPIDLVSLEPYVSTYTARQMPELGLERILSVVEGLPGLERGEYQALIFAGGPLMASIPQLEEMVRLFQMAVHVGAKTVIAGAGIGPLGHAAGEILIQTLLELADHIILRDGASVSLAKSGLKILRPIASSIDPAFFWVQKVAAEGVRPVRNPKQILLAMRDWPVESYSGLPVTEARSLKTKFELELRKLVTALRELRPGARIIPFCMHKLTVGGDDRAFYQRVWQDDPEFLRELDLKHRVPQEDLRLFQTSGCVLAMRFHSAVFSLATGTPFLAVDYTSGGKVAALLQETGNEGRLISMAEFSGAEVAARLLEQSQPEMVEWGAGSEAARVYQEVFAQAMSGASTISVSQHAQVH